MARDEASLLLRAADIISALPWFLFELPALVGASLITSSIVMMFASFGIYGDTVDEIGSCEVIFYALMLVPLVILTMPLFAIIMNVIIRGITFGYEGLLRSATVRIIVSALPAWQQQAGSRHFSLQIPRSKFRHSSFYQDRDLIQACLEWLSQRRNGDAGYAESTPWTAAKPSLYFNRFRRVVVYCGTVVLLLLSYNVYTIIQIKAVSEHKVLDFGIVSQQYDDAQEAAYHIDPSVPARESSGFDLVGKPAYYTTDKSLTPGQKCLFMMVYKAHNWGTIVNVSLHSLADPDASSDRLDIQWPNEMKRGYGFFDRKNFEELVEWQSKNGTDVSIVKEVTNKLGATAMVIVRLWNRSTEQVPAEVDFEFRCLGN